jgi:predicted secreted protein
LVQTGDGGYALAGATGYSGIKDFWLVKTDAAGNAQWNKTYGGTNDDEAYALVQTGDGGYALAGYTASFGAGVYDFWLVKTDANGNMQWNRTYGGTISDIACALVQTSDDGYALAGATGDFGAGIADCWLVKADSNGIAQWNQTYGGTGYDAAYALVQTVDGGYALAGYTNSFGAGNLDSWLVKTDAAGAMQWNRTYGGTNSDIAETLVQTADGGYALAGTSAISSAPGIVSSDFLLIKTDANGNMQWSRTYGVTEEDWAWALVQTSDDGYALAGYTEPLGIVSSDFLLVKTDASGNIGGLESGLAWVDSSANTITLYRGATDSYWNYVRVRLWKPKTP